MKALDCTWVDIQYAYKKLAETDDTLTPAHPEFEIKMTTEITRMNQIDVHQYLRDDPYAPFDSDSYENMHMQEPYDTDSGGDIEDRLPPNLYTQGGSSSSDDEEEKEPAHCKSPSAQQVVIKCENRISGIPTNGVSNKSNYGAYMGMDPVPPVSMPSM